MKYTFDEAFKCVKENSFIQSYEDIYEYNHVIDLDDVIEILDNLEQEYAPTVEMTTFERTNAVGLLDFKRDTLTFVVGSDGDGTPILDTLPKEYFSAWLHPETIKVKED